MAHSEDSKLSPSLTRAGTPEAVADYAQTCVQYVKASLGIELDFCVETLPVLDHYLRLAREPLAARPESMPLLATVVGSYLGEVLRRRHTCEWSVTDSDPLEWSLSFEDNIMTVYPVALARVALVGAQADEEFDAIQMADEDQALLEQKLSELPAVSEEEYLAPSTRLEVIDIAVDLIRAYRRLDEEPGPIEGEPN